MARQDQSQVTSVKPNFKRKKKEPKSENMSKKKDEKSNQNMSALTLDDVFETVVNGTSSKPSSIKKKKSPKDKSTPQKGDKSQIAKKIISSAKKKTIASTPKQKKKLLKPAKLSPFANKTTKPKKLKEVNKRKSDSDVLDSRKIGSGKKVNKTKSWTAVDEEISFSSEDEINEKSSLKLQKDKSKQNKKDNEVKLTKKAVKIKDVKVSTGSKVKHESNAVKKGLKVSKFYSPNLGSNTSHKSAFKPFNKKRNHMKLSVSHLIGAKKKSDGDKLELNKSIGNSGKQKKKLNSLQQRKRKLDSSDIKIETDSDSDEEILYSLSDTSDLAINDPDSSQFQASRKPDADSGRSKSESSVDKSKKILQKGKKVSVTKSKSSSETTPGKSKKIKLLDSLKQTTSPEKLVRPVSPTPVYTTVKHTTPSGSVLQSSQPLLAQPQWVLDDEITPGTAQSASLPISPASMSYKVLLENLPHQLHPKNKKKTTDIVESDIERRVSVRASECAFKYKEIVIKKCHKYTQIWLNTHTKMKNALNPLVMQEISSALNAAKYDDSNLVMFSGLCNVFCSGVDLHYLTVGDKKVAARQMADALRDLVRKFITFPKLIVAVVTGPAIGLGSTLLPLCDIVYASDKATFYMPYAQLSQTPEGCASFTLPNIVGIAMANELLVGGRKITAIEACQLGFVSQVYWPTSMMQEVIPRVQHMALVSGKVLETTKLLIRSHQRTKLDLTNESECNLLVERWPATECQKAIEEFLSNEKNYML
ncbi:chromodomain Y-like protein isoform X2 [Mercenaria mercenaria]|nr:chromodomain Y-like protein isoform X2 [Mercenaria mercenaria]